jgi:hypothetical protein
MKKVELIFYAALVFFVSCKKETGQQNNQNKQLYPLATGNKWIYVDSFFTESGKYYGKDTFTLKAAKPIEFNNRVYTPVTDQYDDSIFILASTDSTVYILKEFGEAFMFRWPLKEVQPIIINSYRGDTMNSVIYTTQNSNTAFPSYRIVITQDDGQWMHYRQQEMFFSIGIGIIKGQHTRKNRTGNFYVSDSYTLITYGLK